MASDKIKHYVAEVLAVLIIGAAAPIVAGIIAAIIVWFLRFAYTVTNFLTGGIT